MESVAMRARTGIAVLYRRWPNKNELVLAAIEHYRATHVIEQPDTGSLRGDLMAALTIMGEARVTFFAVSVGAAVSGLLADTGLSPNEIRDRVLGDDGLSHIRAIYQRADERGEIDVERIPAAALAMPFDLVRHDLLMDLRPLKRTRIESIVDDLFLPLVNTYRR